VNPINDPLTSSMHARGNIVARAIYRSQTSEGGFRREVVDDVGGVVVLVSTDEIELTAINKR